MEALRNSESASNLFDWKPEQKPEHSRDKVISIRAQIGDADTTVTVKGRQAWALKELIAAGAAGCTPITHPGPRWSDYIFKLKRDHGLDIETVYEAHGGAYAGHHARYVLRSAVTVLEVAEAA